MRSINQQKENQVLRRPKNSGTPWTPGDVKALRDLAAGNTPTRIVGLKLGRMPDAISDKASRENISLKPTNKSPYNRRKA
jgi:hypothetical protein